MKNWSGLVQFEPEVVEYPDSEEAVQLVVQRALEQGKTIRIIGTGHSFTDVCKTNQVLLSLDKYQGVLSVDKEKFHAVVKGGTKLAALGDELFKEGMAMENLGDIDVQSIAGTISTGTHGTGMDFGTISTQVIALRFVNGRGQIVECSETQAPDLFKAAQVSLGLLGIITQVKLRCVPAYKLALQNGKESMDAVLDTFEKRMAENRNFEFYWFPHTESFWTKTSNVVKEEAAKIRLWHKAFDYGIENGVFLLLNELSHNFPSTSHGVANFMASQVSNYRKVFYSHKVYATTRLVRFNEMEYNVPLDAFKDVFRDIRKRINSKHKNIVFPIENRNVKGDDILMSPAYGRDSAYIACHAYHKQDHNAYFQDLEEIFRSYGGRPHWGKLNTLDASDVQEIYPEFQNWMSFRAQQDPDNVFVSPYFRHLFGI